MATVQISAELTVDDILDAVKQLTPSELERFTRQVNLIQAQRQTPHLSQRETELLKKISEGLPPQVLWPFRELKEKLEAETITEVEHTKLLHLANEVEKYDVERLQWLIELAQLRRQTVPELIDTLGLRPQYA